MNFDDYKNTKEYPNKENYTKYKIITVSKTYENLNYEEFQKCKNSLNEKYLVDTNVSDEYQKKIDEYYREDLRLENCLYNI